MWLADWELFQYLWLIWMASTRTLHRGFFWTSEYVAGLSTWGHISLWLSWWFRLAKYSTCLTSCIKQQQKKTPKWVKIRYWEIADYNLISLFWPGGLERLGLLSGCSGVPKMFEAILWGFLDAAASSSNPPKRLLEPPPGGRKTLQKTPQCNTSSTIPLQLLFGWSALLHM